MGLTVWALAGTTISIIMYGCAMPSFTKEDLFEELRAVVAAEAARIAVMKGPKAAALFMGQQGSLCGFDCDPRDVDLAEFEGESVLSDAFDYAFHPKVTHTEAAVSDLLTDVQLIVTGAYYEGLIINPMQKAQTHHAETVLNTIKARAKLDFEDSPLFLEELAYLADMQVGSVRNAAKGDGENVLKTYSLGKRTVVEREEAIRWLSSRRGYVPSPIHRADPVSAGDIPAAQSAGELGALLTRLRTHQNRSESDLASQLSWSLEKLRTWESGRFEFGVEDGKSLAKALGLDPVVFVPKAVELALRRDA